MNTKYKIKKINEFDGRFKYGNLYQLILLLSIPFISCKQFLQIDPPKSSLVDETVFKNDGQATAAVEGVYLSFQGANSFVSGGLSSVTHFCGVSSDELIGYSNNNLPFFTHTLFPEFSILTGLYSGPYKSIYTANSVIEGLTASSGVTPPVKSQLMGEALFIRAFSYFYLVNLFGKVPLNLTPDYRVNAVASRASINDVYQQIVSDLKAAEGMLSDAYPSTGRVRPNKSVAQALLARTYLYMRDWENADNYSSKVISKTATYNLVNFDAVFLANSQEAIWQLIPGLTSNSDDAGLFIPGLITAVPVNVSLQSSFATTAFELNDKRQSLWIKNYSVGGVQYYYPFKYKIPPSVATTSPTEYTTILRLAEQYLIRAEARINKDDIVGGIADLNTIRQRPIPNSGNANTLPALSTTLSRVDALLAVEQERRVELFSEWGHRWLDLKRTGKANAVLSIIKSNWQPTDVLYPIPIDEITRNPNISQNDGY